MKAARLLENDEPGDDWSGKELGGKLMDAGLETMGFGFKLENYRRPYFYYHGCHGHFGRRW